MAELTVMKVFVVEDSPIVQERLVAMLNDIQHVEVVGVADNAVDAIAGILRLQPDTVVLDIKLRVGSGIGVLQELRRQSSPVAKIMLTNYASLEFRKQCLAMGADYFFDKTAEFEKIKDALKELGQPDPAY